MNKKFTYLALLVFFLLATAFVVLRYNTKLQNKVNAFYPLKQRTGPLAELPEWKLAKEKGENLIRIVRETPTDLKSTLALATIYIQEGRATGDFAYYNEAALKYINDVLAAEPNNFEAMMLKSVVELSQHHFAEGLQTAEKAKAINPYNAYVYGLITDGNVEMGNYEAAIASLDKMVSIRPDLRSYSRISYLREIHGQTEAAVTAMKMAVEAGFPGEEATEWARVQLAQLYEKKGDLQQAEVQYQTALEQRPGYVYATAGLGNIALAKKDYSKAIEQYRAAIANLNDYSFRESLAQTYLLAGQKAKADEVLDHITKELSNAAEAGEGSPDHHADYELAFVYLLKEQPSKALKHALKEYNGRPNNIEIAELVAWCHYKDGNPEKAHSFLQTAMRTGSKNPVLLCRAGIIYNALGEKEKAKNLLQEALRSNPGIDPMLKSESLSVYNKL